MIPTETPHRSAFTRTLEQAETRTKTAQNKANTEIDAALKSANEAIVALELKIDALKGRIAVLEASIETSERTHRAALATLRTELAFERKNRLHAEHLVTYLVDIFKEYKPEEMLHPHARSCLSPWSYNNAEKLLREVNDKWNTQWDGYLALSAKPL